jgi:tripartite-type tricarboxylate transporter receptor subunit TctC
MRRKILMALAGACAAAVLPVSVSAQSYPSKPLRIIVPATPGGSSDIFARAMAKTMQASMGQPVLVEYKPGAATNIGTDYVAKSAPDGYTVLINAITLATNVTLYPNLPYNVQTDFAPVIEVAEIPNVITVHPSMAVNSIQDLVRMAKAEPGKLNYGTPGEGSSGHLSAELLALKTGAKFTHVAYQGNAQATTDHLGGTLQVGFVNLPVGISFVKAGKLKPLAVTSAKRSPLLPDVPTVAEALGIPDYELSGWFGVVAPAKTPPEIVARLHSEFSKALQDPGVIEVIKGAGADIVGGTSAQFGARIKRDTERLAPVLKASGATAK